MSAIPYWQLSSFYFFYFALLGAWIPYWSLYLKDLGYGSAAIGVLAGIIQATKIIAPNIWGWLGDRRGTRLAIIRLGTLLGFVSFLGIFFDTSFWSLVLVVSCFSFFWNAVLSQFEVVTLGHLQDQFERYSRIRLWGSIGFIIAVAGLGFYFDHFAIINLPYWLALILAGIWVSSLLVHERQRPAHHDTPDHIFTVLRKPVVLAFFISCFLMQIAHGPYYTFFSVYLEEHQYSRSVIGQLWGLGVFAEVILFIYMHHVLRRFSLRAILLLTLLLTVLRWLLIAFCVESFAIIVFAQLLHAASFGSFHAVAIEFIRRFFHHSQQGQGMAFYSAISFGGGGALGAFISGVLWDSSPQWTFMMASGVSLLAFVICWLVMRTPQLARLNTAG